jgi:hypothetical protein
MRLSISIAIAALMVGSIGLSGCSQTREALGLEKQSPDEFQVLARAPLSMPPNYTLRPPQPGAARPQELSARDQAAAAIFANTESGVAPVEGASGGETALLQNAGAAGVDPNIRQLVDTETKEEMEQDEQFIERLVFWRDPVPYGTVVDPQAEQQRLQENAALGRPVTEGESPVVIRKKRALLEGIF